MSWHHIALQSPLDPGEKLKYYSVRDNGCMIEGMEIVCSLHGARFDLRDGCPTAGPARRPLATYPIELRDGELYVSLCRCRTAHFCRSRRCSPSLSASRAPP